MRWKTHFAFYLLVTVVWLVLAAQLQQRHHDLDTDLRREVYELWGQSHTQVSPRLTKSGAPTEIEEAKIDVALALSHRKKGMLWYATYAVDFHADYRLQGDPDRMVLQLPVKGGLFSDFQISIDGRRATYSRLDQDVVVEIPPDARSLALDYRSQGSDTWAYDFSGNSPTRNLHLTLTTDFGGFDFPDRGLSPVATEVSDRGATISWDYQELLSGGTVAIEVPQKENPGPKLIAICRYAPVGLALFLVMLVVLSFASGDELAPPQLMLCTAGYLAFHLLLVYLADQTGLAWAFVLSALISLALVQSYLGRLLGPRFVLRTGLWVQCLYLIGFSSAFLNQSVRGLPLVLLLLITLATLMHLSVNIPEFAQHDFAPRPRPDRPGDLGSPVSH